MSAAGGEPEIDPAALHIWDWFWDAHRGRQAGMGGWLPLPASELAAWAKLTGEIVRPEEWQILRDMDRAFLIASSARGGDGGEKPGISPAAFDVVFG